MKPQIVLAATFALAFLAACDSGPVCPIGFYPSGFGGCVPLDAEDAPEDGSTTDLGDGGLTGDTPAGDASEDAESDTVDSDLRTDTREDAVEADVPEPDVPEADVPEPDVCTPDCVGLECGPDGCGGSCGTCRATDECVEGLCKSEEVPPPATCEEGYYCAVDCGLTEECIEECGIFSASGGLQSEISGALECAIGACGEDTDEFGWEDCAAESCPPVRDCLGLVAETGECTNSADIAVLEELGGDAVSSLIGDCTLSCFTGGGDTTPCISECVEEDTGISSGCSTCFGEAGSCTLAACIFACLNPTSPACTECVSTNCGPAFEECAGLPLPG